MAAELLTVQAHAPSPVGFQPQTSFPPINFIYGHFHNSIRAELSLLADRVRSLEVPAEGVESMLTDLRERYKFLEQVYKYHSAVEDEVCFKHTLVGLSVLLRVFLCACRYCIQRWTPRYQT